MPFQFQQVQQLWPSSHKHDPPGSCSAVVRSTSGPDHRAAEARERAVGEADARESKQSESLDYELDLEWIIWIMNLDFCPHSTTTTTSTPTVIFRWFL